MNIIDNKIFLLIEKYYHFILFNNNILNIKNYEIISILRKQIFFNLNIIYI